MGTRNTILLSDCTLGFGAKLIGNRLAEDLIRNAHRLLDMSGVELFDIGVLRSHSLGPNCMVFDSTELPREMKRKLGARYAMQLSEFWPDPSALPERSERTVDVLRVFITKKKSEAELEYCQSLREKGYEVCVLIEETAQYSDAELGALLRRIAALRPWACFIFDNSGVLRPDELESLTDRLEKTLPPEVILGFHPCDNLEIAMELAERFCARQTERRLCLEASAVGIGNGSVHLSLLDAAGKMNKKLDKTYALPPLAQLEAYFEDSVSVKKSPGARLGYYATAKAHCSYRYTEYYSSLGIDVSEHEDICAELPREDAFSFDKHSANRALLRFRKKRLSIIIIIIPSANRPQAVDSLLFSSVKDLLCCGVDILIYDSSDDDRTYAVTRNFQLDGYDNVLYERYKQEGSTFSIDKKVISAFWGHLDYDYIWCMRDGCIPTIWQFYNQLLALTSKGADCIVVDADWRNSYRSQLRLYNDCVAFLSENSARTTILGSYIFKNSFIKKTLENYPLGDNNSDFYCALAPLYQMATEPFSAALIIGKTYIYNQASKPNSFWQKKTVPLWAAKWRRIVMMLPEKYDAVKEKALRVQMIDFNPFHLRSLLNLRANGGFSVKIYMQYKEDLLAVSDTPLWKFRLAAIMPRFLARLLVNAYVYADMHSERKIAKLLHKLQNIYCRLGR